MVVPAKAQITISSLESICIDTQLPRDPTFSLQPVDAANPDYMEVDLIQDLFLFVHQGAHHPSRNQTHANFRSMAWIPNGFKRLNRFIDACTHCLPNDTSRAAVGNSTRAAQRFQEVILDHKVFDDDIKRATAHAGCLSAICNTSRIVMFAPVLTLTAEEAARVF